MKKLLFLISLLSLLPLQNIAGQVVVNIHIDSTEILIGQQAHIDLKVTAPKGIQIDFPTFPQKQLIKGIEVLKEEMLPTEELNGGKQQSTTKRYTITSFDSTFYYMPPFKVKVEKKEYESNSLALKVLTMEVDTAHVEIFCPPKDPHNAPYTWSDWKPILWLSLLLVFLIAFATYIIIQIRRNRPILKFIRLRPILPPHLWAMKEITKIKEDIEIKEDSKEYYSQLTDVLRSYLQQRYNFSALEMTSEEIITQLQQISDPQRTAELRELFATADLAKFAKLQPEINENDNNLLRAINFIEATKPQEEEKKEEEKKIVPQEVKRTNRDRLILKVSVAIVLILALAILFEIGRTIYNMYW